MTGKCYYVTTLGGWRKHAPRYANSHYVELEDSGWPEPRSANSGGTEKGTERGSTNCPGETPHGESGRILVLIEADEGAHNALQDDPAFEALPHPLSRRPISAETQAALAERGISGAGLDTFETAEKLGEIHPLLRHRVF